MYLLGNRIVDFTTPITEANVLGDEIGVTAQPVAGALDLNNDGVVEQPIKERGGNHGIAEHLAPFGEAAVRG